MKKKQQKNPNPSLSGDAPSAITKLRQEYCVSSGPAWATEGSLVSKKTRSKARRQPELQSNVAGSRVV